MRNGAGLARAMSGSELMSVARVATEGHQDGSGMLPEAMLMSWECTDDGRKGSKLI